MFTPRYNLNIAKVGVKRQLSIQQSIFLFQVYLTLITFAVFIIPAIIIAFCYGILVYIIVSKNSALKATVNRKQDRKPLYYNNGR